MGLLLRQCSLQVSFVTFVLVFPFSYIHVCIIELEKALVVSIFSHLVELRGGLSPYLVYLLIWKSCMVYSDTSDLFPASLWILFCITVSFHHTVPYFVNLYISMQFVSSCVFVIQTECNELRALGTWPCLAN